MHTAWKIVRYVACIAAGALFYYFMDYWTTLIVSAYDNWSWWVWGFMSAWLGVFAFWFMLMGLVYSGSLVKHGRNGFVLVCVVVVGLNLFYAMGATMSGKWLLGVGRVAMSAMAVGATVYYFRSTAKQKAEKANGEMDGARALVQHYRDRLTEGLRSKGASEEEIANVFEQAKRNADAHRASIEQADDQHPRSRENDR